MKDPAIFLHNDYGCPPFAWPKYSKRTPSGDETITYPANLTLDLLPPAKRTAPKRKRASKKDTEMIKEETQNDDSSFEDEFQISNTAEKARRRDSCVEVS